MQGNLTPLASRDMMRSGVALSYARVQGMAGPWFFLDSPAAGNLRAVRAASCLLAPAVGDHVLLSQGQDEHGSYILAVLSQAAPGQACLHLPGDAQLGMVEGALQLTAQQLVLNGETGLTVRSPALTLDTAHGRLNAEQLDSRIGRLSASLGRVRTLAESWHSTVGRLVQRARDSFRWTEGVDETRAGRVRLQVDQRLQIEAEHADLKARGQFRVEGQKIDLG